MIFLNISATKDYPYLHSDCAVKHSNKVGGNLYINDSSKVLKYKIATYPTIFKLFSTCICSKALPAQCSAFTVQVEIFLIRKIFKKIFLLLDETYHINIAL